MRYGNYFHRQGAKNRQNVPAHVLEVACDREGHCKSICESRPTAAVGAYRWATLGPMGYKTYTCPISRRCGGCELLNVPYEIQLRRKQSETEALFKEIIEADHATLDTIRGMERPLAYRHKAATPFAPGKMGIRCGFYERGTHDIVFCRECLVEAKGARKCLVDVAHVASDLNIGAYREDEGKGILRHAVVRVGYATKESLLTIVTNGETLPRSKELARRLMAKNKSLVGVVQNINPRRTNAILGPKNHIILGSPTMRDKLLGVTFEIGAASFYQTNPEQTEVLYDLAIEGIEGASTLLDAYCGCGTIGVCAAALAKRSGREIEVVGVEKVSEAVGSARKNARINDVAELARFKCADATEWMAKQTGRPFEALVLDPPRAGSTPEFLDGVCRLGPKRVVYVSCNTKTQVRDLAVLRQGGYRVKRISPVDLFPHTLHVETVCLLTHKN